MSQGRDSKPGPAEADHFDRFGWVRFGLAGSQLAEADVKRFVRGLLPGRAMREVQFGQIKPSFNGYQSSTREAMSLHTDNTYSEWPCDIVGLFCIRAASTGGETLLVDSSAALPQIPPRDLAMLEQPRWRWRSPDGGLTPGRPVVESGSVRWWRWRLVPASQIETEVADAFEDLLSRHIKDLRLVEQDLLFFSNNRVLHGRSTFSGSRCLQRIHIWLR